MPEVCAIRFTLLQGLQALLGDCGKPLSLKMYHRAFRNNWVKDIRPTYKNLLEFQFPKMQNVICVYSITTGSSRLHPLPTQCTPLQQLARDFQGATLPNVT